MRCQPGCCLRAWFFARWLIRVSLRARARAPSAIDRGNASPCFVFAASWISGGRKNLLGPRLVSNIACVTCCTALLLLSHTFRPVFIASVLRGEKPPIYSILAYLLPRLAVLKKRAYVARYLAPLALPAEFLHEESVAVRTRDRIALKLQL